LSLTALASETPAPLGRAERGQHEHVGRASLGRIALTAQEVAAVGGPERPGELELGKAEPPRFGLGQWGPREVMAYLLGAIGTTGSGIWLIRLISFAHWPGWRIEPSCWESFLLEPNSGVNEISIRLA